MYVCACMYVCMYVCVYVCMCVCVYVNTYVHTNVHTHTYTQASQPSIQWTFIVTGMPSWLQPWSLLIWLLSVVGYVQSKYIWDWEGLYLCVHVCVYGCVYGWLHWRTWITFHRAFDCIVHSFGNSQGVYLSVWGEVRLVCGALWKRLSHDCVLWQSAISGPSPEQRLSYLQGSDCQLGASFYTHIPYCVVGWPCLWIHKL